MKIDAEFRSFFSNDPKGQKLINYYILLEQALQSEQDKIKKESANMLQKLDVMRTVILTQQDYALSHLLFEQVNLTTVIEDALTILHDQLNESNIVINKNFDRQDKIIISVQKSKLIQILINLFKNAVEALIHNDSNNRWIKIEVQTEKAEHTILSISDNGEGININNMNKIFTHGFTTKKEGHGFGLHNSANFMGEMGGRMSAESDGIGKGSKFTLSFSTKNKDLNN